MRELARRRHLATILICTGLVLPRCNAAPATGGAHCGRVVAAGLKLLTMDDLDASDKEAFVKRSSGASPGCAVLDLNGDGTMDAALIGQDLQTGDVTLVVALGKPDGSFSIVAREPLGSSVKGLFLVPYTGRKVVTTQGIDGQEDTVRLSGDAVELVFIEKAAVVYFWDQASRGIRSVQTAD